MEVVLSLGAQDELRALPPREADAMLIALEKLRTFGDQLRFPHSSAVKGVEATLRELRPRSGRSPWRAFYRRVGDRMVVGAIRPEANVDPRRFRRAVDAALERLARFESEATS